MNLDEEEYILPEYVGEALKYLFNEGFFGKSSDDPMVNDHLMDHLPYAKHGLLSRSSIIQLLTIYLFANNLVKLGSEGYKPDNILMQAFGGNIPAVYFSRRLECGRDQKFLMKAAIDDNLITEPLNTYQVLTLLFPPNRKMVGWTPETFDITNISSGMNGGIVSVNTYRNVDISDEDRAFYSNPDVVEELFKETHMISTVYHLWTQGVLTTDESGRLPPVKNIKSARN